MKVRNGFVSNSSSSSYIVTFKNETNGNMTIKDIIQSNRDDFKSLLDLFDEYDDYIDDEDSEYCKDIDDALDIIKNPNDIVLPNDSATFLIDSGNNPNITYIDKYNDAYSEKGNLKILQITC
jgi:hypothetical protein